MTIGKLANRFGLALSLSALIGLVAAALPSVSLAQVKKEDTIESLGNKTYKVRPGKLIVNSTDKARDSYEAFLELVSEDPELRAEAMRRLGDLELDALESEELAEGMGDLDMSGFENAVDLFSGLLEAYPDYRRNDTVLYQLARAYETGGQMDDSLRVLDELVSKYPDTDILHEVQFRRGEMLFLRKDYAGAEEAYRGRR